MSAEFDVPRQLNGQEAEIETYLGVELGLIGFVVQFRCSAVSTFHVLSTQGSLRVTSTLSYDYVISMPTERCGFLPVPSGFWAFPTRCSQNLLFTSFPERTRGSNNLLLLPTITSTSHTNRLFLDNCRKFASGGPTMAQRTSATRHCY
jgi:hypothetical protein